MHVVTPECACAKARAMLSYAGYDLEGEPIWSNHNELLGGSLARDLLRGA